MSDLTEQGDNSTVDILVGDIYRQDYSKLGLKSTMIASSFGRVFKKGEDGRKRKFSPGDSSRSLLYAISTYIGRIACVFELFLPYFTFLLIMASKVYERREI